MRPDIYFLGLKLRLQSPLAPDEFAARVNEAAGSFLNPFTDGVAGGVSSNYLRLARRRSIFEFNAKPVLAGWVSGKGQGSQLDLRYAAPGWAMVFFPIWYVLLLTTGIAVLQNDPERSTIATFAFLLLLPVVLQVLGTMRSDEDLDEMLSFLFEEAGATA